MRCCTRLEMLELGNNRLTGKIPNWLGSKVRSLLVLSLRSNEFYGDMPSGICSLENLQVLDLSSNNISGAIPKCPHLLMAMTQKPTPFQLDYFNSWTIGPSLDNAVSPDTFFWMVHI